MCKEHLIRIRNQTEMKKEHKNYDHLERIENNSENHPHKNHPSYSVEYRRILKQAHVQT